MTVNEPRWCVGEHADGLALSDLMHDGREIALTVPTPHGRVEILNAALAENPYAPALEDRAPRVTVLLDGAWYSFGPEELRLLAAGLVVHAGRLRDLAAELARLRAEGPA